MKTFSAPMVKEKSRETALFQGFLKKEGSLSWYQE